MGKNPAFLFYPGDWIQDTKMLSLRARGAWIDLLCAMWRSAARGTVTLSWAALARLLGAHPEEARLAIDELVEHRICDYVTDGNGNVTLMNRRMVREERQRNSTRLRVEKFRNAQCNNGGNSHVTPPSSVSVTDSVTDSKKKDFLSDSFEVVLSKLLVELIRERNPTFKEPNIPAWAKHIDLMIRIDRRDPREVEEVLRLCQKDSFWQNNILSTEKLRKQYDQLKLKLLGKQEPSGTRIPPECNGCKKEHCKGCEYEGKWL